jgi:hypothetical protein
MAHTSLTIVLLSHQQGTVRFGKIAHARFLCAIAGLYEKPSIQPSGGSPTCFSVSGFCSLLDSMT